MSPSMGTLSTGAGRAAVVRSSPRGTVSLTAQDAQTQAVEALFGGPAPRSSTETSMLERAG